MKKTLLSLMVLTALVAFAAAQAEAADFGSVSVTTTMTKKLEITVGPNWAIGNVVESDVKTSGPDKFTVTNTSNASCTLTTTVGNDDWTFDNDPGIEKFAMDQKIKEEPVTWTPIAPGGTILKAGLAAHINQIFDLKFYAPTQTSFGGVGQSIDVTITAS